MKAVKETIQQPNTELLSQLSEAFEKSKPAIWDIKSESQAGERRYIKFDHIEEREFKQEGVQKTANLCVGENLEKPGEMVGIWETEVLKDTFAKLQPGDNMVIEYEGKSPEKNGKKGYHKFHIYIQPVQQN